MRLFSGTSQSLKISFLGIVALVFVGAFYLAGADQATVLRFFGWAVAVVAFVAAVSWASSSLLSSGRSRMILRGLSKSRRKGEFSIEDKHAAKEIREKFIQGLDTLRKRKVNLYTIPWYLVIGESGVGKTEAIRRGRIDLIHGLHDPQQGKGGTRDMHWWFTANAVLLDTAGRMVFPEKKSESTPAWCEMLEMLKRYRANCPVNGIMLMISAESLVQDSEQEVISKAEKISREVYAIRDVLDLRFPIYVMITKCDRIAGFKEFFAGMEECDQILGWSNPEEHFSAEGLKAKFAKMMSALYERRDVLLRNRSLDTFSEDEDYLEKSEAWYAFPKQLERALPNLQKYMRTVFPDEGAFAGKRPFMRGIYFTSAMREGNALDVEVAKKFAIDVDELPEEASVNDAGISFFLRDLFKEKIFREKGMVTPETDTRQLVWQRRAMTLAALYVGLLSVAGAAFWGIRTLNQNIQEQQAYWVEAANEVHWSDDKTWSPSLVAAGPNGFLSGENTPLKVGSEDIALIDFHVRLQELALAPITLPPVLKPIRKFTDLEIENQEQRLIVQRRVFEQGVLRPLYEAARSEILNTDEGEWNADVEDALLALIRIEGAIEDRKAGRTPLVADFKDDVGILLKFATGSRADPRWAQLLVDTYEQSPGAWPPEFLSDGVALETNDAVAFAFEQLIKVAEAKTAAQETNLKFLKSLSGKVKVFEESEKRLLEALRRPTAFLSFRDYMERIYAVFGNYENSMEALNQTLQTPEVSTLLEKEGDWFYLEATYEVQFEAFEETSKQDIHDFLTKLNRQLGLYGRAGAALNGSLALEARRVLEEKLEALEERLDDVFSNRELAELERYDEQFLSPYLDSDDTLYQHRSKLFQLCYYKIINSDKPWRELMGRLPEELRKMKTSYLDAASRITGSQDSSIIDFHGALTSVIDYLEHVRMSRLSEAYVSQARAAVREKIAFPLVFDSTTGTMERADVLALRDVIGQVREDLPEPMQELFAPKDQDRFEEMFAGFQKLEETMDVFFNERGYVRKIEVSLPEFAEHKRMLNEHFLLDSTGKPFPGDIWKLVQFNQSTPVRSTHPKSLGISPMDAVQCNFTFYRFPKDLNESDGGHTEAFQRNWAPLFQVYEGKAIPSADYKTWDVPIWIGMDEDESQPFFVRFTFDRAIPASKHDWPTTAIFE